MAVAKDPKKLSYEEARDALADVVESLESGQSTLEESLALWERGEELAKICQQWLDGAKAKLAKAKSEADK
ncbi:MAG: exodeoxyribonuclease VII small subunit [Actinomycetes bacterium]|jgi:exodeoxyribonuclease VII small subunit|nr:exodeoxyribonuclease VII small subunit [Actinomycetota bacterium]